MLLIAMKNRSSSFIQRIVRLPRLARILIIALFALAVTLSLSPLVDYIYSTYFFSMETRVVPSLISAGFGLIMYLIGWWLMVGTIGERPAARTALLWYLGTGILAIVVVSILVLRGVSLMNFTPGS